MRASLAQVGLGLCLSDRGRPERGEEKPAKPGSPWGLFPASSFIPDEGEKPRSSKWGEPSAPPNGPSYSMCTSISRRFSLETAVCRSPPPPLAQCAGNTAPPGCATSSHPPLPTVTSGTSQTRGGKSPSATPRNPVGQGGPRFLSLGERTE